MAFIGVLCFAAERFSARRYPVLVALTSMIGTAGNVFATLPLQQLLAHAGWAPSFVLAGSLSLATGIAVWTLLDDGTTAPAPMRRAHELRRGVVSVSRRVGAAWRLPGTRLGFWVHFASMSTATAFGVLWGQPYLVAGDGFSSSAAGALLMTGVLAAGIASPLVGWFIGRHPNLRVGLSFAVCATTLVGWAVAAFLLGNHPPHSYIETLFVLTMLGGPASMVAFSVARDYNPERIIGTASGVVNVGGFLATAAVSIMFGALVTALGGTSPAHLRIALLVPVAVQLFGSWRIFVWLRRQRGILAAQQRRGAVVPVRVQKRFFWDERWTPDAEARESVAS